MINLYEKFDDYGLKYFISTHLQDDTIKIDILTEFKFIEVKLKRIGLAELLEDMYNIYNLQKMKNNARQSSEIVKALLKALFRFESINSNQINIERIQTLLIYNQKIDFFEEFLQMGIDEDFFREYIHESADIKNTLIVFREKLAEVKRRTGDVEGAELLLNQVLRELKLHGHGNANTQISKVQYNLGLITFLRGNLDKSIEMLCFSSKNAFRAGNNLGGWISRCVEYRFRMLRALLHSDENKEILNPAINEFEQTLNQAFLIFQRESHTNPLAEAWVMNVHTYRFNISFLRKDTDDAKKHLSIINGNEWIKKHEGETILKPFFARFAMLEKNWSTAVKYFEEYLDDMKEQTYSKQILRRTGQSITEDYYYYGIALKGSGNLEKAEKIWQDALAQPDGFGNKVWKKMIEAELFQAGLFH